ncbi:hypothetical protein [Streptomyces sp. V4I2]|nr:hypothetical protein [Streptomyces sp. V4I2]MDQ1052004.1 hypothetical protein [Streptomyces sp. V4I2]
MTSTPQSVGRKIRRYRQEKGDRPVAAVAGLYGHTTAWVAIGKQLCVG